MLYADYFDPFNCECKAYGRLKQENREDLAIRAHGYLLLTPEQEAEVEKKATGVKDPEQASWNFWGRAPEHRYLPVRAILKDLIRPQDPFSPGHVSDMWSDLEDLHRLDIIVRDINVFNYLGGKMIDFSRAWTTPHPFPTAMASYGVKRARKSDPMNLHKALIEWGMERRWDWDVIPEELIKRAAGMGTNGRYGVNPSRYDWRKWEKDPAAADTFMEHQLFARIQNADQALEPDHQEASTAVEHSSQQSGS
ncbi:hypothetical protein NEMBOFW57_001074 [Staphylotrichum longicolle]|uniref:Uncharacterized protein n=1 Tax=Staphylotrichum longicolle TaxID=669026 RepID=A0AAD4HXK6_9PEZI|nr:hypothetical protein NEMBOFW57_001074 [Staphylotrichum longicolle]